MIEELLQRTGLKYEDLNATERETLYAWTEALEKSQINIEKIRQYISAMRESVENELCSIGHESKQDIFLKARLRNYILLEAFLSTPEKAKQAIERQIAGLASNKK